MLDKDNNVENYSTQVMFFNKSNKRRYIDFLVKYKNQSYSIIEVKPERRLVEFKDQINDNVEYANKNNWAFSVWTEKELKLKSEHYILKWANQFIDSTQNVNLVEEKR